MGAIKADQDQRSQKPSEGGENGGVNALLKVTKRKKRATTFEKKDGRILHDTESQGGKYDALLGVFQVTLRTRVS